MIEGTLANPDETWEKAYKFNFGMDMELFKGLSLTADYSTKSVQTYSFPTPTPFPTS